MIAASSDLVFIGPPGSGKGTQARLLVDENGWEQLSTGELFRLHARVGSQLGNLARSYMEKGEYVPDEITIEMVRERLREIPRETRIIFDGFPRTVAQAEALDGLLKEFGRTVGAVVAFDVPWDELRTRILGRASSESRDDDAPDVIERRHAIYERQTAAVLEHYEERRLLRRIEATGAVDDVAKRVRNVLDGTSA